MRIRSASERDVEALAAVMAASPLLRRYRVSARLARESLREALRERDVLLVALATDEVVGLAWVITTRALDQAAYLRLLLVAEGQQSRGAGAALLARAEGRARRSGCRHLVLLVTKSAPAGADGKAGKDEKVFETTTLLKDSATTVQAIADGVKGGELLLAITVSKDPF